MPASWRLPCLRMETPVGEGRAGERGEGEPALWASPSEETEGDRIPFLLTVVVSTAGVEGEGVGERNGGAGRDVVRTSRRRQPGPT
jgi:hypothetical protein